MCFRTNAVARSCGQIKLAFGCQNRQGIDEWAIMRVSRMSLSVDLKNVCIDGVFIPTEKFT